jgi:hypothetical protein
MKLKLLVIIPVLLLCVAARADCPPGDFNGDCQVDMADLVLFANQWMTELKTPADLNRDGRVDGADLALFGRHWRQRNCPLAINEVLAHSHEAASDWIELYNTSSIAVHIGGWFLSDNKVDLQQYEIAAGTTVEPHGYIVFYETTHFANPFDPGRHTPFAFSENGEAAYLYSGNDSVFPDRLVGQSFGASETSCPFGRYLTSTGRYDFVTMSEPTPGAANAYPRVGPVVINEIMYHPAFNANAEYVELLNISGDPVTLFDSVAMEPWRLTDDVGIDLWLPADVPVTLKAGEYILLVRDPQAMRQYNVPAGVQMLNWGAGKLDNRGGTLRLLKPGDVDKAGTRYWIEVDRISYSDGSHPPSASESSDGQELPGGLDPWPVDADGFGCSLSRLFSNRYGNDPNNWQATVPTPGSVND